MKKLLLLAAVFCAAPVTAAAQDFRLERLLGKDTAIYLSLNDAAAFSKGLQSGNIYKLLTDESVRGFLKTIETPDQAFENGLQAVLALPGVVEKETGRKPLELLASLGPVSLALTSLMPPGFVAAVDLKGDTKNEEHLRRLLAKIEGDGVKSLEIEGVQVTSHDGLIVGKIQTAFFIASDEELARALILAASKPPEEPLASAPAFQHAKKSTQAADGALFLYVNAAPVLDMIEGVADHPAVKPLLDAAAVSRLTYIALSVGFEDRKILMRLHANTDLKAPTLALNPDVFERAPSEVMKDASVRFYHAGFCDVGRNLRDQFPMLSAILQGAAQAAGIRLDLRGFPIESIDKLAGTSEEAVLVNGSGLSLMTRSDLGIPFASGGSSPVAVGILSAMLMPAVNKAMMRAKVAGCANNLSQLWKMQQVYRTAFGGPDKEFIKATGKDFWLGLSKTDPPLIEETNSDIYICPDSGIKPEKGSCSYWGPGRDANTLAEGDPVGMCDNPKHGGNVNILLNTGAVVEVTRDDPLYMKAIETLKR